MNEVERADEALEIIAKQGDLYDVIAKEKNVKPTSNGLARFNVLFFSRILFAGVLLKEKISSYFSPVGKVHAAQEDIRSILGVNVDIITYKVIKEMSDVVFKDNKKLGILYEDRYAYMDEYIGNVQKIYAFCSLHNIDIIYILVDDLINLFPGINLQNFYSITRKSILNSQENKIGRVQFLSLNQNELKNLINIMSGFHLDKNFLMRVGNRIQDISIKNALEDFSYFGDIEHLINVTLSRLCLNINSDSSYRTREYGKTYDTVVINGEYIRVLSNAKNAPKPETSVMPLWEYLGFPSYNALLNSLDNKQDDEERLLMAALYLYLCKQQKIKHKSLHKTQSFYDYVYESYLDVKENKTGKKVNGLYTKNHKIVTNILAYCLGLYYTGALLAATGLGLGAIDFINYFILNRKEDPRVTSTVLGVVTSVYKASWDLESSLIHGAIDGIDDVSYELSGSLSSFIGDSFGITINGDKVVGNVVPLDGTSSYDLPNYYAAQYGASSQYKKGNISYDLKDVYVDYLDIYDAIKEAFRVETYFTRKDIKEMITDNYINIPLALYPVDDNYYITKIIIYDEKDKEKAFQINCARAHSTEGEITDEEKSLLLSMRRPAIRYYYAHWVSYINTFASNIAKEGKYLDTDCSQMREIIVENLGLAPGASLEEIYNAIKSKEYSLKPFKDAGLDNKIKSLDEKEFIGTVASMDSLICNLAATLAVEANDELVYVVGFYSADETITYSEAHAWAMVPKGDVVDVTPLAIAPEIEEEKGIIENILSWATEAGLPFYMTLSLIALFIYKTLGKRVVFKIKKEYINSLLSSADMGMAYSLINEVLYGGISLPVNRSPEDNLMMITKDFEGYTKEELTFLLNELKQKQSKEAHTALKVVKSVPFIKENEAALVRGLKGKKPRR